MVINGEHDGPRTQARIPRLGFRVQRVLAKSRYFVSDEGGLGDKETDKKSRTRRK